MKQIPTTFQSNNDKCGIATYTLVEKDEQTGTYLYERKFPNYTAWEVFTAKIVKAGSPLPNGTTVQEDYVQYPGSSLFGKGSAYSCNSLERAEIRFLELIDRAKGLMGISTPVSETDVDEKSDEVEVGVVHRGGKGRKAAVRPAIEFPSKTFKMKELLELNKDGWTQGTLYIEVQKLLGNNTLQVAGTEKNEGGRGKKAVLYRKVG